MSVKSKLAQKADKSFVDDWRNAYKWLSVQFAFIFGSIITLMTAYPEEVLRLLEQLPDHYRIPLAFFVSTILPAYLRLKTQGGTTKSDSEE